MSDFSDRFPQAELKRPVARVSQAPDPIEPVGRCYPMIAPDVATRPRDTALICRGGHVITDSCERNPSLMTAFCRSCGLPAISKCESCGWPIEGIGEGGWQTDGWLPKACSKCGKPLPWARQETVREEVYPAGANRSEARTLPKVKLNSSRDAFLKPHLAKRTRNGIADGAEVSSSSLQRWHEGKSRLSPDNRVKLAKLLKVDPASIPND